MPKATVATLDEVPKELHGEYVQQGDKYVLKVEGTLPGFVPESAVIEEKKRVDEFRANNKALNAAKQELAEKLKAFDGVDPTEYTELKTKIADLEKITGTQKPGSEDVAKLVKQQVEALQKSTIAPLEKRLAEAEAREADKTRKLQEKELEGSLRAAGTKAGIDDKAMPDFLSRGLRKFQLDEKGSIVSKNPLGEIEFGEGTGEPLTPEEWAERLQSDAPHLFKRSGGGGANTGRPDAPAAPRREVAMEEFGNNLEDIAKGKAIIRGKW